MSVRERTEGPGSHSGDQVAGIVGSMLYRGGISGISPRTWLKVRWSGQVLTCSASSPSRLCPGLQCLPRADSIPRTQGHLLDPLLSDLSP